MFSMFRLLGYGGCFVENKAKVTCLHLQLGAYTWPSMHMRM